jgi:hypothetical protein
VIKENGRPTVLALNPDGTTAAALNTDGATTCIVSIFDLVNHKVLQQTGSGKISNGGLQTASTYRRRAHRRPAAVLRQPRCPARSPWRCPE